MSAVRSLENTEHQPRVSRLGWAVALGLVCLFAAGLFWPRQANVMDNPAQKSTPVELALNVDLPSPAQVAQWTKKLDAPLEDESKLVLGDAQAALNSLARGFVPENLLASSTPTPQP